jgi:transcriptional regulator with XRE-family HTH domain
MMKDQELAKALGARIKARRLELGVGPGELMDKLGCTLAMVNHYETGKFLPSVPRLVILAKALRVSTDELLGLRKRKGTDDGQAQG